MIFQHCRDRGASNYQGCTRQPQMGDLFSETRCGIAALDVTSGEQNTDNMCPR